MDLLGFAFVLAGSIVVGEPPAPAEAPIQRPVVETPEPVAVPSPAEAVPEPEAPPEPEPEAPPAPLPSPEVMAVPTPTPEPMPSATSVEPAPAQPTVELPDRTGKGLIIGAAVSGAVGWGAAIGTTAATLGDCSRGACGLPLASLIGLRWLGNGAALGLAIPGSIFRGRYDATAEHLGLDTRRDPKLYVRGGAIGLGVGSAAWLATRMLALARLNPEGPTNAGIVGYFASLQLSWTMATVGAGFLSYGLALQTEQKRLGRLSAVHIVPQLGPHDVGLSLGGRF